MTERWRSAEKTAVHLGTNHPEARKRIHKFRRQLNQRLCAEKEANGLHKKKMGKKAKTENGEQASLL